MKNMNAVLKSLSCLILFLLLNTGAVYAQAS